jgi:hypothetical protein
VIAEKALIGFILHQLLPYHTQSGDASAGEGHQQASHQVGNAQDKYYPGTGYCVKYIHKYLQIRAG